MDSEFHRIRRLPPYVFAEVNKLKAAARAAGRDIIDFGMGNPDQPPPRHVTEKLAETLQDPRVHRYSNSRGIPGLRRALAAYYARRFGVEIDPEREAIVTLGSKEGLANLAQAITSPGDVILAPNPSYPIHAFGFVIAGASIRSIPFEPGPGFLEALDRAVRHSVPKPLAVVVNYPSNPDGGGREPRFLRRGRRLLPPAWHLHHLRHRLCRGLFRGPAAALDPGGAGRQGDRRRVQLPQQDLFHAGLAHRLLRRQCQAHRRSDPGQILSRLRRLHAHPGGGHRRPQRPAGLRRGDALALPLAPRRADRGAERRRLAGAGAHGLHVRLGPHPRALPGDGLAGLRQAAAGQGRCRGRRRASASANMATAMSASRWWRTSSARARRCATSRRRCARPTRAKRTAPRARRPTAPRRRRQSRPISTVFTPSRRMRWQAAAKASSPSTMRPKMLQGVQPSGPKIRPPSP